MSGQTEPDKAPPEIRVVGWRGLHGPPARSFTRLWEGRARREFHDLNRFQGFSQAAFGRTAYRAEDRRVWLSDIVRGQIPDIAHDLLPGILDAIAETAAASVAAGHRVERMWAAMAPQVHRLWCETHVGPASPDGWPLLCGIVVKDTGIPLIPPDWDRRSVAFDPDIDKISVHARKRLHPVLRTYVPLSSVPAEGHAIYRTLRADGMPLGDATAASGLLS